MVGSFLNSEGSALYALQSVCNHSCDPNAMPSFPHSNFQLVMCAVRDIAPGDEILISYLDDCVLERSRHSRHKILRYSIQLYNFILFFFLSVCTCQKLRTCLSFSLDLKTVATNEVVKEYHLLKQADCGNKPKERCLSPSDHKHSSIHLILNL